MIDTKELRIGNYVFHNGREIQVDTIDTGGINEDWDGPVDAERTLYRIKKGISYEDIDPIPLTPEWLERCGFAVRVHEKGIKYIEINKFLWLIVIEGAVPHLVLASAELMHDLQTRIQYVHQLQNLYFCLTGEELQIKMP